MFRHRRLIFGLERGNSDNVNTGKKKHTKNPINIFEKSVYVWCWFVMFASESSHASSFKNFWICASQKPQPSKKCTTRWKHWDRTMPPLTKRNKTCTANKQNTLWRKGVVSFFCRWLCVQLGRLKVNVSGFEIPEMWLWSGVRTLVLLQQSGRMSSGFPTVTYAQRITVED